MHTYVHTCICLYTYTLKYSFIIDTCSKLRSKWGIASILIMLSTS